MESSSQVNIIFYHSLSNVEYLSEGNFGVTFKATWRGYKTVIKKPGEKMFSLEELEKELITHQKIPKHDHILPILGLCPNFTYDDPKYKDFCPGVCIVTLFCEKGDLSTLLIQERKQLSENPNFICPQDSFSSIRSIITIATQVASGLNHLHRNNVIHRDIAARNVLVTAENKAMICDFGLSRHIPDTSSYYKMDPQKEVPIRWLAPESLITSHFTSQSDVWMFGVFLWELITGGLRPYNEITDNINVMCGVSSKQLKLSYPSSINPHPQLLSLVERCMNYEPNERPSMSGIIDLLDKIEINIDQEYETLSVFNEKPRNLNNTTDQLDLLKQIEVIRAEKDAAQAEKEKIKQEMEKEIEKTKKEMEQKLKEQMNILYQEKNTENKMIIKEITMNATPSTPISIPTSDYNSIIIIGGNDSDSKPRNSVELYNIHTQQSNYLPSLLMARQDPAALLFNQKLFCIGGWNIQDKYLSSIEIFDFSLSSWSLFSSPINIARRGHRAIIFNDSIFIVGGFNGDIDNNLKSVEIFIEKQNKWINGPPLKKGRSNFGLVVFNNCLYSIGGKGDGKRKDLDSIEKLSINSKTWELGISTLPSTRSFFTACTHSLLSSCIYLVGGYVRRHISYSFIRCDFNNLSIQLYEEVGKLPFCLSYHDSVIINNTLYLIGGYIGKAKHLSSIISYNLDNQEKLIGKNNGWYQMKNMKESRIFHAVVPIPSSLANLVTNNIP